MEVLFGKASPRAEETAAREAAGTLATFVYARLHNFAAACQSLAGAELTAFVNDVRRTLSGAMLKLGGEIAQRRPDSILCAFTHRPEDRIPTHAQRGLHAAIVTVHDAMLLAGRVADRLEAAGLPPLSIAVGVHLGEADVTPRASSPGMVHAVGEAVEIARLLEVTATDLHWGLVASAAARQAAGARVAAARAGSLGLPGDSFLEIAEITALVQRKGSTTPAAHYEALRNALAINRELLTLSNPQPSVSSFLPGAGQLVIEGYRLLRKIGEGGIASIYLAQPFAGGAPQVLKMLRLDSPDRVMDLQRFMQEFALLAQIDHPNVARIHKQDFSIAHAYIAMEYFPLGDLRTRMRRPLDPGIALYYVKQIAAGLEAIHQVGIVHRDLKPDNVMVRQDGMVAIADFGIAKQVAMHITDTGAGEVVGTPYYLSPEQAIGRAVDARCDIYSLGIMAFEMLAGTRPYDARTAEDLLRMHVNAPLPRLPAAHARLQPVLDRMLAKNPDDRFASAAAVLDALKAVGV